MITSKLFELSHQSTYRLARKQLTITARLSFSPQQAMADHSKIFLDLI